ncbi:helix-turn-helix domain-containing protein [Rhodococcus spelaei]|uniref:Helix-turn-helix domain-containing protein n=1 Tax=Rhodococcus spelaei TaxID=2546320 RepID=A0A541BMN4_9NOCA|nr:Rv2175c family DNA-binding protein [Rhodococcus spelaei]TQF73580.1 helix-turn-helix domain-containing protein [Rhodococcus spelaei]
MSAIPYSDDVLDPSVELWQLPDVAKLLGVAVTRVHQMLRDGELIAVRRSGVLGVPEAFFVEEGEVVRFLPGLLVVLRDGGYSDEDILRWLFTEDETLPGTPAAALHGDLAREVVRRAQAMAF